MRPVASALVAGVAAADEPADLPDQAARLIGEEVTALKYAAIGALTVNGPAVSDGAPPDRAEVLRYLVDDGWPGDGPGDLARAAGQVRACGVGPVAESLAVTLDYLAVVADCFGPSLDQLIADVRDGGSTVETLADARAALSVDAKLAGELVYRVRG